MVRRSDGTRGARLARRSEERGAGRGYGAARASAIGRLAGGLLVLTALGCDRAPAPSPRYPAPMAAPRRVAVVTARPAGPEGETVPATVRARERATLTARVAGSVVALPFGEGDAVPAGAVVARVEATALRAALAAANAERDAAEADRVRASTLLSRGAATPQESEQANARSSAARAKAEAAREALGYAELRAPFAGRVAARPANVGDVVMPGAPLVELDGESGLEVVATVAEDLVARLSPGTLVAVDVDGQAAPIEATVRAVSPRGDPATHRVLVRADLPSTAGVRAGLFARFRLAPASVPKGAVGAQARLLVPERALVRRGGLLGVFVVSGGRARLRWLAVGEPEAGTVEVRAGLRDGERVVADPSGLVDGAAVQEG
jgi:RND family efflux transporter MFP subunit